MPDTSSLPAWLQALQGPRAQQNVGLADNALNLAGPASPWFTEDGYDYARLADIWGGGSDPALMAQYAGQDGVYVRAPHGASEGVFNIFDASGKDTGRTQAFDDKDNSFRNFLMSVALLGGGAALISGLGGGGAAAGGGAMDTAGFEGLTSADVFGSGAGGSLSSLGTGAGYLEGSGAGMQGLAGSDAAFNSAINGGAGIGALAGGAAAGAAGGGSGLGSFLSSLGLGNGQGLGFLGPLLTGLTSLNSANKGQQTAQDLIKAMDPFAPYRAGYADRLQQLEKTKDVTGIPGYQAGLQAVERSGAAQGYTGSGNMMKALQDYGGNFYNAERDYLATMAGGKVAPGQGAVPAANIIGQSLGSQGYGISQLLSGFGQLLNQYGQGGGGTVPNYGNPAT